MKSVVPFRFRERPAAGSRPRCLLVAMIALVTAIGGGCSREPGAAARPERSPVTVITSAAQLRPLERAVTAMGSLRAMDHATVSIKTTGRLRSLSVDVGSPVKAGDVLAQVEPRDYELRVQQSAALLAQARARLGLTLEGEDDSVDLETVSSVREAKALFEEATRTQERARRLKSEKISSQAELERAEAEYEVNMNRYHDAVQEARERKAILAQRRAEHEIAKQQLTDTSLRAPFEGVVQARLTNVGEFLTGGSPVLTLVRIDPLRLRLEVPERHAPQVRTGQPVRLRFEGMTNLYTGAISRVSPALDERSRMLVVEAELRNPGNLRPGAFARAEIITETAVPALAVPADSIITFAGTEKVFLVQTNRASERRIGTGRRQDGWVEVLSGLRPGDKVIRRPTGIAPRDRVQLAPETLQPEASLSSGTNGTH